MKLECPKLVSLWLRTLCCLAIGKNKITSNGLLMIPESLLVTKLKFLYLSNILDYLDFNPIGSKGVKLLIKAEMLYL